jgi:hypothetical protein
MTKYELTQEQLTQYDALIARGLCSDIGNRDGQMCIEAAVCTILNLPHGDDPGCVSAAVRSYKIRLNDSKWSSPQARAAGLRDLGLAQLGSKGVVDDSAFANRLAELTIRELIPALFRDPAIEATSAMLEAAARCEAEGTADAARYAARYAADADAARYAAYVSDRYAADAARYAAAGAAANAAANAAAAARYAADAARYAADAARYAVYTARYAAYTAYVSDRYLTLSAGLALRVLRELGSPGVALLVEVSK